MQEVQNLRNQMARPTGCESPDILLRKPKALLIQKHNYLNHPRTCLRFISWNDKKTKKWWTDWQFRMAYEKIHRPFRSTEWTLSEMGYITKWALFLKTPKNVNESKLSKEFPQGQEQELISFQLSRNKTCVITSTAGHLPPQTIVIQDRSLCRYLAMCALSQWPWKYDYWLWSLYIHDSRSTIKFAIEKYDPGIAFMTLNEDHYKSSGALVNNYAKYHSNPRKHKKLHPRHGLIIWTNKLTEIKGNSFIPTNFVSGVIVYFCLQGIMNSLFLR